MTNEKTSLKNVTPAGDSNTSHETNQSKINSTFFQSVLNNKFLVTMVVVVLGAGVMAYTANPVASSNQLHLGDYAAIVDGSKGGGFTDSKNGGITGDGIRCMACPGGISKHPPSPSICTCDPPTGDPDCACPSL